MLNFLIKPSGPVIITGAGGWLGQAALEMCGDAEVIAYGSRARSLALRSGRRIEVQPLQQIATLSLSGALVLHCAFLTREHASLQPLAHYIAANREISALVQGFLQRNGAAGLFVPSSGAAYAGTSMEENPYGALKCEDEEIFARLGQQLGFPTAITRVFNLAGPFINKLDSYALACIISDILKGGPITLRAAHPVWRGYAHVEDVLNIALGCLQLGNSPPVFDTGGEAIEIGALAMRAARLLHAQVEIQRPDWHAGNPNIYLGDNAAYAVQAGRAGVKLHSLDAQILDTAEYIRADGESLRQAQA
jgi:nucleoside-diphosphate-sugar epimerase